MGTSRPRFILSGFPPSLARGGQPLRLLEQVRLVIRTHHFTQRTEKAYVGWVRCFVVFSGRRHPADMGPVEVSRFLTSLATDSLVSASTQNQALWALVFLYRRVLRRDLPWLEEVLRAKRPKRLPVVAEGVAGGPASRS